MDAASLQDADAGSLLRREPPLPLPVGERKGARGKMWAYPPLPLPVRERTGARGKMWAYPPFLSRSAGEEGGWGEGEGHQACSQHRHCHCFPDHDGSVMVKTHQKPRFLNQALRRLIVSTKCGNTSPALPLMVNSGGRAAIVCSRLRIKTVAPRARAIRGREAAGSTTPDVPIERKTSQSSVAA